MKVNAWLFLGLVVSCGLWSSKTIVAYQDQTAHASSEQQTQPQLLNGERFSEFEDVYNEQLPAKDYFSSVWSILLYQFFDAGKSGIIIGQQGWLFSREEFAQEADAWQTIDQNLATIKQVAQNLQAQGIELQISLLPEKIDLYRDKSWQQSSHNQDDIYGYARAALSAAELKVVDIRKTWRVMKQQGVDVFYQTDTHWTPDAAASLAKVLATNLPQGQQQFQIIEKQEKENQQQHYFKGDLLSFIPMHERLYPYFFNQDQLAKQQLIMLEQATTESEQRDSFDALFVEKRIELALVGTSYSADPRWMFDAYLKYYSQQELINFAQKGKGPLLPMFDFVAQLSDYPEITQVIWEIPVRYLYVDYQAELVHEELAHDTFTPNKFIQNEFGQDTFELSKL